MPEGGNVRSLQPLVLAVLMIFLAVPGHAQTTDMHVTLSASPDRNEPPVDMDMSWAREGNFALPQGKTLRLFALWGDFGRAGQWLSRYLPQDVRAGKSPALMFEDGRWQRLKPVGIRHGLELPFGYEMAKRLADDVVGVVVCSGSPEELAALVMEAKAVFDADVAAVVQLRARSADRVPFGRDWPEKFGNPDLVLVDVTPYIPVSPSDLDWSAAIRDKGAIMAEYVFNLMN